MTSSSQRERELVTDIGGAVHEAFGGRPLCQLYNPIDYQNVFVASVNTSVDCAACLKIASTVVWPRVAP